MSRSLSFTKMHGAGNDFVCLDAMRGDPPGDPGSVARIACDRRRGIGGDGLLVITPAEAVDARMVVWNADGGEMADPAIEAELEKLKQRLARTHPAEDTKEEAQA